VPLKLVVDWPVEY